MSFKFSKIISPYISVISRHHFLKMSYSSKSTSEETFKLAESYPPVYVLTRIRDLYSSLKSLSNDSSLLSAIKNIQIPDDDSNILSPSSMKEIADAEVVVIDAKILALNYESMPKLNWAHCTWAGIEPLFEIMKEKPQFIITRHGEEEFSVQIAEYVLGQVLSFEKGFRDISAAQILKSWPEMEQCVRDRMPNRRLKELVIGVLGVGNMGQAIAKFFQLHGTTVIGLSRSLRKQSELGFFNDISQSLNDILSKSDYIVNTLPSTPETVGLLDGNALNACTKMPVFINVGRGNIINEDTLVKALEKKWINHVILDVFQEEPLPSDSKLWDLNGQVTITPHCAAISQPILVAKDFLSSLICYHQKRPMRNVVDWEKGY